MVSSMAALALGVLVGPGCDRSGEDQSKKTAASTPTTPSVSATKPEEGKAGDAKTGDAKADDAKAGDAKADDAKADEPPTTADPDAPPEGWTRLDLSTTIPTLAGTVDLPPGVTAEGKPRTDTDADGMIADGHTVLIGQKTSGLELETLATVAPRYASMKAMLDFHTNLETVSTHEFSPDHWAIVQKWREGECLLHGWSKSAGLTCDVFKDNCEDIKKWVEVCGTVRPGPTPNKAPTTPKSAFPKLDEAAATVAIKGARAVVRKDMALLRTILGPDGVKIGKKAYTADAFEAALAGKKSMLELVGPDHYRWVKDAEPDQIYQWNSGPAEGDQVKVWFSSGYGDQAYFVLQKTGSDWHLVQFDVEDFGEP